MSLARINSQAFVALSKPLMAGELSVLTKVTPKQAGCFFNSICGRVEVRRAVDWKAMALNEL